MSRNRIPLDISSQQQECHCLGYASRPHPQQYFLSQHKSLQIKNKPSPTHSARHQDPLQSIKNSGKRSLRKNFKAGYQSPVTARSVEPFQEYYSQKKITVPNIQKEQQGQYLEERRSINFIKPEKIENRNERKPFEIFFTRNNNQISQVTPGLQQNASNTYQIPSTAPMSPISPRLIIAQTQPQPIRINFSHSPPTATSHRYSPLPSPREFTQIERQQTKKPPALSDLKQELRISITPIKQPTTFAPHTKREMDKGSHEEMIDFELTQDNMDSPRNMPVQRKKNFLQVEDSSKQNNFQSEYFTFGETFKSKIDKPKSNKKRQTYRSKIQTNKSRIDTTKSRIDPKKSAFGDMGKSKVKSLRQDKKSLKKMDDVQEIRSMIDSDELEDEDKESVVLGRLHQYGSMLDPSLSLTTPTLRSKLISMNTQSSTIGKSFMRPFQFSIERTHFK